jgi:hypothetical protein
VRDPAEQPAEVTGEVRVPGVGVDEVGAGEGVDHLEVHAERPDRSVRVGQLRQVGVAGDRDAAGAVLGPGSVERVHPDVDPAAEDARELGDVHAGAAVDVGRVLAGNQVNSHVGLLRRSVDALRAAPLCTQRRQDATATAVRGGRGPRAVHLVPRITPSV